MQTLNMHIAPSLSPRLKCTLHGGHSSGLLRKHSVLVIESELWLRRMDIKGDQGRVIPEHLSLVRMVV